jgi:hypothetical protein
MLKNRFFLGVISISLFSIISGCKKDDVEPPAKSLMQGTWELTAATNENGQSMLDTVAFPVTVIQLTDDNGMIGTQGPMFTYTVYGGSKWVTASAKIKQAFDYANFRFNTGEYFVASGNPTRFTVEAKLQATALAGGLTDILSIMGVGNGWLQQVIYHKFVNVKLTFPETGNSKEKHTMIWEFDSQTTAAYNYKDSQGNSLAWGGWPVNTFSKGKYTFTKRISGLNDVVSAHL